MKNIHIPNSKKKINFKKFDINKIIKFEKLIFEKYNKGMIKFPIHLTKGNEKFLKEIFHYISPKDWIMSHWRNHAHALLHGISEKILYKQIMNGKSMSICSFNGINRHGA